MKNTKNKSISSRANEATDSYFYNHRISLDDYENIRYPDIDTKRAVIEKMLADKINDLYMIIDEMQQK